MRIIYIMIVIFGLISCSNQHVATNSFVDGDWGYMVKNTLDSSFVYCETSLIKNEYSQYDAAAGFVSPGKFEYKNDSLYFYNSDSVLATWKTKVIFQNDNLMLWLNKTDTLELFRIAPTEYTLSNYNSDLDILYQSISLDGLQYELSESASHYFTMCFNKRLAFETYKLTPSDYQTIIDDLEVRAKGLNKHLRKEYKALVDKILDNERIKIND